MIIIGSLSGITAWFLTLIQFARVHAWGPFTPALFFSGIMILVYLIVGAQPSQPVQYAALSPGAYPPPVHPRIMLVLDFDQRDGTVFLV